MGWKGCYYSGGIGTVWLLVGGAPVTCNFLKVFHRVLQSMVLMLGIEPSALKLIWRLLHTDLQYPMGYYRSVMYSLLEGMQLQLN